VVFIVFSIAALSAAKRLALNYLTKVILVYLGWLLFFSILAHQIKTCLKN